LETSRKAAAPDLTLDPVTGLPIRSEAERVLAQAVSEGHPFHTAVVVIDSIERINLRFGQFVGDEILQAFVADIRKRLPEGQPFYRWSAQSLVVPVPQQWPVERVREELKALMESRREFTSQSLSKTLHLPISARWIVVPPAATAQALVQSIDHFAAAAGPGQ
jgi:GGDEF domain-containing protein